MTATYRRSFTIWKWETDMSVTALPNPEDIVDSFASGTDRYRALVLLKSYGPAAVQAARVGLKHDNWHVRHWCAIFLDRNGNADSHRDLLSLLQDPAPKVRLWAVHSISCQHCKDWQTEIDVVPLLMERMERDTNLQVRKMAVAMLGTLPPDRRALEPLRRSLKRETDRKIRLHTNRAIECHRKAKAE